MNRIPSSLRYFYQLILRLALVMILFTFIKIIFYWANSNAFPAISSGKLLNILLSALRFDLSAVVYINSLFILSSLIPFKIRDNRNYQSFQLLVFLLLNGIALIFECIDIGFYRFANRRTIGSDLNLFRNTSEMIPGFLAEYWILILCFICFIFFLFFFCKKIKVPPPTQNISFKSQLLIFFFGIGIFTIAARGGIQLRPLMPLNALQYVEDSRLAALVNNTSLNLIFSTQQQFLEKKNYFPDELQQSLFNTQKQYHQNRKLTSKNVFIIVLESFGEEHISFFHPELNTTPFLDSLIKKSFRLEQSYANGLRSTQGIVAISTGIPALMQSPLMFSAYQSNRIDGLAELLAARGYKTAFFHGANPGSMAFEQFSEMAGFQDYHDRRHFNNDVEYDGQWGIWDEPFFQYALKEVNQYKQPFLALFFSLTSHHPYQTPDWFEKQYPEMRGIHRSIRYTDYALESFFKTAEKMPWYKETIFVITADHSGVSDDEFYQTRNGKYKVPVLLFDPQQMFSGLHSGIAQQIDIQPTILDFLGYDAPFKSYGESMLDSMRNNQMFNFNSEVYQILDENSLLLFDGQKTIGQYDYRNDPFLINKKDDSKSNELEDRLKAILQQYHREMIDNDLGN